jgi:hypothetical protein
MGRVDAEDMSGSMPSNKEMKLTKPGIGKPAVELRS